MPCAAEERPWTRYGMQRTIHGHNAAPLRLNSGGDRRRRHLERACHITFGRAAKPPSTFCNTMSSLLARSLPRRAAAGIARRSHIAKSRSLMTLKDHKVPSLYTFCVLPTDRVTLCSIPPMQVPAVKAVTAKSSRTMTAGSSSASLCPGRLVARETGRTRSSYSLWATQVYYHSNSCAYCLTSRTISLLFERATARCRPDGEDLHREECNGTYTGPYGRTRRYGWVWAAGGHSSRGHR